MIINALNKLTNGGYGDWINLLPSVLWAEHTSTNIIIDKISFKLMYGFLGVLFIKTEIRTWNVVL